MKKLRVAIFDLTDCEGCELELVNLREKIAIFSEQTEIINWRLASSNTNTGPFDVTFVEGTPITEGDIETLKQARAQSKLIVGLGSCAVLGGVQGSLTKEEWEKGLIAVYGKDYKTKSKMPRPISYYIDVDYLLPGCPVNTTELAQVLASLLSNKKPVEARFPVCLECKGKENCCLLLQGEPCLGPVTKGGCEAACPSRGLRCWGCFGALRGGNTKALKNFFDEKYGKERTKQLMKIFYANQDEYKELYASDFGLKEKKPTKVKVRIKD